MRVFGIEFNNDRVLQNSGSTASEVNEETWCTDSREHAEQYAEYKQSRNSEVKGIVEIEADEDGVPTRKV